MPHRRVGARVATKHRYKPPKKMVPLNRSLFSDRPTTPPDGKKLPDKLIKNPDWLAFAGRGNADEES